ncbi:MAG: secondary thiamine-phosphate synthase enzyme YjbQ [Methanosarcinales archaeon]|nr:secondary thiamine-phosphate synthase enzyme YjbQ [Methanosarcinales archaeon]
MKIINEHITFKTKGHSDIVDITGQVQREVNSSGLNNGSVLVFVPGATGSVTTIEYEPGLVADMKAALETLAPQGLDYDHNLKWGDGNGHSHIRASMLGPSLVVPFIDERLTLGTWQQIIFIDMDNRPRSRELILQITGE